MNNRLTMEDVTMAYDNRVIAEHLNVTIPDNTFTAIIGPNGCGKSTLLRGFSRVLNPQHGKVLLDGRQLDSFKPKEIARELGLLPQTSIAPEGIRVYDLIARGRAPTKASYNNGAPPTKTPSRKRSPPRISPNLQLASSMNSPVASANECGWPCCSPSKHRSCFSTSPPPSSTSPTNTNSWNCCAHSTRPGKLWSLCFTISTKPPATPTTSS